MGFRFAGAFRFFLVLGFITALLPIACRRSKIAAPASDGRPSIALAGAPQGGGIGSREARLDAQDADWVPGEHKKGMARFKDTGVYVDGRPVGVLSFGELPIGLEPVWIRDKVSTPKRFGDASPGWKWSRQRRYRFQDYLRAVGVDTSRVKEVHVYGPKPSEVIVATAADLMAERGRNFMFRFGGEVDGKPIPVVPPSFGNGKTPDKITAVSVYMNRTPPKLVRNVGMVLEGERVQGIPYYGEPMRGGVRVYFDNKLAIVIKRRLLEDEELTDQAGRWRFFAFLEAQGLDTEKIADAWIVRNDRRVTRLARQELIEATFTATPQARGRILLGDNNLPADAITLHSRPIPPQELPQILPDEET